MLTVAAAAAFAIVVLKRNAVLRAVACHLPVAEHGLPLIGSLGAGCYVATGHSCWGILNGPATGKALAELISDGAAACLDLRPFAPSH